jgi:hypothetical protein
LPLKAKTILEAAEALRSLYPYLSIEACTHIARHGYTESKGGRFIPKYDTRMSGQIERSGYTTEELYDMIKHVVCPTLIVRGKKAPFSPWKRPGEFVWHYPEPLLRRLPGQPTCPPRKTRMPLKGRFLLSWTKSEVKKIEPWSKKCLI